MGRLVLVALAAAGGATEPITDPEALAAQPDCQPIPIEPPPPVPVPVEPSFTG
jgi:hypothetical protein